MMKKFEIIIHTLKATGNFLNKYESLYATFAGHIYFINRQKLEMILSLMKLLFEYHEYSLKVQTDNITLWLKNKNILQTELLEEICYYKMKYVNEKEFKHLYQLFPNKVYKNYKICYQNYLCTLLKSNLKNLIIFDYLSENSEKFNSYFEILLNYAEKNKSFEELKENITEKLNIKLVNEFSVLNNLNIKLNSNICIEKLLTIKKIITNNDEFYNICIKPDITFCFEAEMPQTSNFKKLTEKYLQISKFLNTKRTQTETNKIADTIYAGNLTNGNFINRSITNIFNISNFSFLNFYQILFYALNDENQTKLNCISEKSHEHFANEIFYFQKSKTEKTDFVNYATINIK